MFSSKGIENKSTSIHHFSGSGEGNAPMCITPVLSFTEINKVKGFEASLFRFSLISPRCDLYLLVGGYKVQWLNEIK